MSFSVPTFNLSCNIWQAPNAPPAAPDVTSVCNLAYGRRVNLGPVSEDFDAGTVMTLLLPPGVDIRSSAQSASSSWVEVPAGSLRYYATYGVDDVGKGFSNEHRAAILYPVSTFGVWPTPYP